MRKEKDLKTPNPSPDEGYVQQKLFETIQARMNDKAHLTSSVSLYMRRMHLAKLISHYEIFRMVQDLPGSIAELGVFKGESLLLFAKLMEISNINDRSCKVIGFDNFKGFTSVHKLDGEPNPEIDKVVGGWSPENYYEDLLALIGIFDHDRFVGQKARIELIEGDILETVPKYAKDNPGLRLRLLHLDCDMYEPTLVGLEHLFDRVVKGGIVLFDQFGFDDFPGESKAFEDFFGSNAPVLKKLPFNSNPGGYFIK